MGVGATMIGVCFRTSDEAAGMKAAAGFVVTENVVEEVLEVVVVIALGLINLVLGAKGAVELGATAREGLPGLTGVLAADAAWVVVTVGLD